MRTSFFTDRIIWIGRVCSVWGLMGKRRAAAVRMAVGPEIGRAERCGR
jgi:hypothetical protein